MDAFPADVALPALARALRDTSAQVRAAAADGLGGLNGADALTLARTAWEHDSSYAVRASAVAAIARLDPTGRRDFLRKALATASYQDAIQNAALTAIARSNDTSMLADLERVVGDQALPSRVLAAFAARGNQRAVELLATNLNDDRGWVRAWTLAALGSIEAPRRLALLESALPKLTHAETRAAVERAVAGVRAKR
jgi:HEAT repeat protein